jgi:signal transduction histidine kinase/CheY-like chemotaxis protein/HPt (histidine-containing phosphotransfer) domain-containing protein
VLGRPIEKLVRAGGAVRRPGAFSRAIQMMGARGLGKRLEVTGIRSDGSAFSAEAAVAKARVKGRPVYTLFLRDITQARMDAQALLAAKEATDCANEAKSRFLANMSHEIRTPINGMIGTVGLLSNTELNSEQREYVEIMQTSSEALLKTIHELLVYASLESGRLSLEPTEFDLPELLEQAISHFAPALRAKSLPLLSYLHGDAPARLKGDGPRLRKMIDNLLSNAITFTDRGRIVLAVTPESRLKERAMLRFSVRDTGVGIAPESHEKLFEPFTQLDASATREHGGAGLGLAITRRLAARMGGTMGVKSAPGRGSTFWFSVPLEPAALPMRGRRSLEDLRVLVVDDDRAQRRYLCRQLRAWNVPGLSAASGAEALRILRAQKKMGDPFTLVLIDAEMPDMKGRALAQAISRDRLLQDARLVLMSAAPGDRGADSACPLAWECLAKPLKFSDLWKQLSAVEPARRRPPAPPVLRQERDSDRPVRILVAEDNEVNQVVAVRQLEKLGYQADTVGNGLDALKALEKTSYDVILMDCQMPKMDGYRATGEIRQKEPSGEHVTIIAMTAHALQEDRDKCLASGMDDYLSKPVTSSDLQSVLNRWLAPARRAAAAPEGAPPVAMERLLDLCDAQAENLARLVELYVRTTTEHLEKLDAAIAEEAPGNVEFLAHNAAGSSAMVGMNAIVPPLRELEALAAKGDLARAGRLMSDARKAFQQILTFLEAAQEGLRAPPLPAARR